MKNNKKSKKQIGGVNEIKGYKTFDEEAKNINDEKDLFKIGYDVATNELPSLIKNKDFFIDFSQVSESEKREFFNKLTSFYILFKKNFEKKLNIKDINTFKIDDIKDLELKKKIAIDKKLIEEMDNNIKIFKNKADALKEVKPSTIQAPAPATKTPPASAPSTIQASAPATVASAAATKGTSAAATVASAPSTIQASAPAKKGTSAAATKGAPATVASAPSTIQASAPATVASAAATKGTSAAATVASAPSTIQASAPAKKGASASATVASAPATVASAPATKGTSAAASPEASAAAEPQKGVAPDALEAKTEEAVQGTATAPTKEEAKTAVPGNATSTTAKSLNEHIKDIKSSLDKIKSLTKEAAAATVSADASATPADASATPADAPKAPADAPAPPADAPAPPADASAQSADAPAPQADAPAPQADAPKAQADAPKASETPSPAPLKGGATDAASKAPEVQVAAPSGAPGAAPEVQVAAEAPAPAEAPATAGAPVAASEGAETAQPEAEQVAESPEVIAEIDKILQIINEIKKLDDYEIEFIKKFIDKIEIGLNDIKLVINKPEFGEKLESIDKNVRKLEIELNIDTSLDHLVDDSDDVSGDENNKNGNNNKDSNNSTGNILNANKEKSGLDKLVDNINGMDVEGVVNKQNDTDLLTKVTMIIYDIIMMLIVFFCIIIFILNVVNIIKFLYKCFIEVGSIHHNDLDTGETFRYILLHYVLFINYSNIPSIFSSFNSANTSSSTFLKLTEVIKNAFNKKDEINEALGLKETFGELFKLLESKKEKSTESENKGESSVRIIEDDNNKKFKEPEFNLFLVIRLLFLCLKLFISLITIMLIVLVTFILLQVTVTMGNMTSIKRIELIMKQDLFSLLLKLLAISLVFILVSLVVYKTMFVKIYENYLKTYVNILAIDIELNIIKKLDGETALKVERIGDYFRYNINNNTVIEKEIINIINNDNISEQTKEKIIIIYMLLNHVNKGYKNKKDYDKIFNYFMTGPGQKGSNNYRFNFDMGMENEIVTFYSLIPNKHRKVPIAYYKYESIEGIKDIKLAEEIRQKVNNKITNINRYISEANNTFDDDNFIVNLGWYFLVNLIISTIYIIIVITYIYKIITDPNFKFMSFVAITSSSKNSEGGEE